MIENARREGQAVHCLMIDIDGLKGVNDSAGRRAGDAVLVAVASAVRTATRSTDVVARWDGDAFVVLGPGTGVSPLEMERRVRAHLGVVAAVPRQQWPGRVSAGSATLVPWDEGDLDSLLQRAEQDMALRRALRRRAIPGDPAPSDPGDRTILAASDET
jgi:diguanylate cyclase (GGDEF)-like protein